MSKINPDWYADEILDDIKNNGVDEDLTRYLNNVERDIEVAAIIQEVNPNDIPLDDSGYYEPRLVQAYAALLYQKRFFKGYWGSSEGEAEDIYKAKLDDTKEDLRKLEPKMTAQAFIGIASEDGTPQGKHTTVKSIPMYSGAPGETYYE